MYQGVSDTLVLERWNQHLRVCPEMLTRRNTTAESSLTGGMTFHVSTTSLATRELTVKAPPVSAAVLYDLFVSVRTPLNTIT